MRKGLFWGLSFFLFFPLVLANLSDLYDFSVQKISADVSFYGIDTTSDLFNDTIRADLLLNETGKYLMVFDVLKDNKFVSHKEFNASFEFSENIAKVNSGLYRINLLIVKDEEVLFEDAYDFSAENFDDFALVLGSKPKVKEANYEFFDTNSNGLYDYLAITPEGLITVYDVNGEFAVSTGKAQIRLEDFYLKRVECPCRIVVDFEGEVYEATTNPVTYSQFEKPVLPDLYAEVFADKIIVHSGEKASFDFSVSVYEGDELARYDLVDYLKRDDSYEIDYSGTPETRVYVDLEDNVEESNEENNFAQYVAPTSAVDETGEQEEQKPLASLPVMVKDDLDKSGDESEELVAEPKEDELANETSESGEGFARKVSNLLSGAVTADLDAVNKIKGTIIMITTALLAIYIYSILFKKK